MKHLTIVFLLSSMSVCAMAQTFDVRGTVLDDEGNPQIGAAVFEKGTDNGTVTDIDGHYSLKVQTDAVLIFSYQGFLDHEEAVNGRNPIDVSMSPSAEFLSETVIVGYGVQKSKDLTASIVNVKGEELSMQTAANPMSALQGMVAGVNITQNGAPGAGPSVAIRGVGSIGDYSSPLYVVDGVFVDNIDFLSSSDIESLTVLKDASSAAIYGVRAANGVILVTTKKGHTDRLNITYDGYAGVQVPIKIMKLCDTEQYVTLINEANKSTQGWTPLSSDSFTGNTDWYAELVRPAFTTSHNIELSGASEKTNYCVGLDYYWQDGIMNHCTNNYSRFNIRARLDQKMTSWLKMGFNLVLSRHKKNNYPNNAFSQAFINPPVYNVYNENNTAAYPVKFDSPQLYGLPNSYGNPVAEAYYYNNSDSGIKPILSLYGEFSIVPSKLLYKISYNLDYGYYDRQSYIPEYYVGGSQGVKPSSLNKNFGYNYNQIIDNVLTYTDKKGFNDFSVMVGQSTRMYYSSFLSGTGYSVPDYDSASRYLLNGSYKNQSVTDGGARYNGLSFFTRGTYSFKGKYLFTATIRADASSKYQEKWGVFPSVGIGWVISDEKFMKGRAGVNYLKLRASWGMLGNDNVPANSSVTLGTSGIASSAVFGNTVVDGRGAQTVYNNYLKWEVVTETNIGLDFGFLGNRLTGELELYHRVTDNVVFYVPVAAGGGTTELLSNNGKVLNQGVEFSVGWADRKGDFSYNINLNTTFNRNNVLALNGRDYLPGGNVNGYSTRTQVGLPIGSFWGYEIEKVYENESEVQKDQAGGFSQPSPMKPGYFKYKDTDGNGKVDENDKTSLGSPLPWLMMGLNFGFKYRGWDLSMLLNARIGNKLLNAKRMHRGVFPQANFDRDFFEHRWTADNPRTSYPSAEAAGDGAIQQCNGFYVEDGSSFEISNIQTGYTFSGMKWAQSIRLYLSAQRPVMLFGYNGFTTQIGGSPTSSGIDDSVYPMQSIYTMGVTFNF